MYWSCTGHLTYKSNLHHYHALTVRDYYPGYSYHPHALRGFLFGVIILLLQRGEGEKEHTHIFALQQQSFCLCWLVLSRPLYSYTCIHVVLYTQNHVSLDVKEDNILRNTSNGLDVNQVTKIIARNYSTTPLCSLLNQSCMILTILFFLFFVFFVVLVPCVKKRCICNHATYCRPFDCFTMF